ncbi:tyrosine-type recombinase/integrase [Nonomuraea wenchangensis]
MYVRQPAVPRSCVVLRSEPGLIRRSLEGRRRVCLHHRLGRPALPGHAQLSDAKLIETHNKQNPRAQLPHARLHDLRHIHATTLLLAGVPVHVVAARLGHADPAITLRVCAHVIHEQAATAAEVFARVING